MTAQRPLHVRGASEMKLTGLLGRKRGADRKAAPAPARGLFSATPEDLQLERSWLQLTRIDTDQFRHFFDRYHDHVLRYLAACVESEETAQDLTQETFLYALENLWRFNWQRGSFGVWLFHIARRRVLPRYRRSSRRASEQEYVLRHQPLALNPDPVADRDRAGMLARLRRAVQELSPQRRDAFVLRVQLEYSLEDTALMMGVKPATVLSLLQRGRPQLAAALREERALTPAEKKIVDAIVAEDRGLTPLTECGRGQDAGAPVDRARAGKTRRERDDDEA
ncbi:RNA polymerase sigma factor [bacterium]|nr:RNA polymerase sigma factor [bacterium]